MVDTADADVRMLFEKHMAREQRTLDDTLKITGRTRPSRYIQAWIDSIAQYFRQRERGR